MGVDEGPCAGTAARRNPAAHRSRSGAPDPAQHAGGIHHAI